MSEIEAVAEAPAELGPIEAFEAAQEEMRQAANRMDAAIRKDKENQRELNRLLGEKLLARPVDAGSIEALRAEIREHKENLKAFREVQNGYSHRIKPLQAAADAERKRLADEIDDEVFHKILDLAATIRQRYQLVKVGPHEDGRAFLRHMCESLVDYCGHANRREPFRRALQQNAQRLGMRVDPRAAPTPRKPVLADHPVRAIHPPQK